MGRVHLRVGTRYTQDAQTYVVVQVVEHGRLVVENQSEGGRTVVTRAALTQAWREGALRFVLYGGGRAEERARTQAAQTTDLHTLPEGARADAWRRYRLIAPLLEWAPERRTRDAITAYLANAEQEGGGRAERGCSRPSVERYLRAYEASGGDLRALVPTQTRRDAGKARVRAEVEEVIQEVLGV